MAAWKPRGPWPLGNPGAPAQPVTTRLYYEAIVCPSMLRRATKRRLEPPERHSASDSSSGGDDESAGDHQLHERK
eukprot:9440472-Pyramimonas_sp.AAC.1